MTTYRIGKLIYCNTRIRHDLADCPSPTVVIDPYCTGDRWYRWVEHGCRNWVDNKHQARAV